MSEVMTAAQYRALTKRKQSKYRNIVTEVNGRTFDSRKEAHRFGELRLMERKGLITGLECQKEFTITVNGMRIGKYRSDFTYIHEGKKIVEDVKSPATRSLSLYKWKKKLLLATHGIEIREV